MAGFRVSVGHCKPEECGFRCQEACPTGVFLAVPVKKLDDPGEKPDYRIAPRFSYFCNGCKDCVTACPENVIVIRERPR